VYQGLCAEYCGLEHAKMHFLLVAESPARFETWLAGQRAGALDATGRTVFEQSACAGCHTVRGTEAVGTKGPDLTHLASRQTLAGDTVDNTAAELRAWITDPQSLKRGALMPAVPLSRAQLDAIVAYLRGLR